MKNTPTTMKEFEQKLMTNDSQFSEKTHEMYNNMTTTEKEKIADFIFDIINTSRQDGYESAEGSY